MNRRRRLACRREGFTLVEMLVTIMILLVLVTLIGVGLSASLRRTKVEATRALIQNLSDGVNERFQAFLRSPGSYATDLAASSSGGGPTARDTVAAFEGGAGIDTASEQKIAQAIFLIERMRVEFPQAFDDFLRDPYENVTGYGQPTPDTSMPAVRRQYIDYYNSHWNGGSTHDPNTESSACLLMILRFNLRDSIQWAEDALPAGTIVDTDNDGLPEIVDAYNHPIRFYRWPIDLVSYYHFVVENSQQLPVSMRKSNLPAEPLLYGTGTPPAALTASAWYTTGTNRADFEGASLGTLGSLPAVPFPAGGYSASPRMRYFRLHRAYSRTGLSGRTTINERAAVAPDTAEPQPMPIIPTVVSAGPDGEFGFLESTLPADQLSVRCGRIDPGRLQQFADDIVSFRINQTTGGRR